MDLLIAQLLRENEALSSLVSGQIWPTTPATDHRPPFLVYSRTNTTKELTLNSVLDLAQYEYAIDYWAYDYEDCITIGDAVETLSGYRSDTVQGIFQTARVQVEEEFDNGTIFHGQQIYTCWA